MSLYINEVKDVLTKDYCLEVINKRLNDDLEPYKDLVYWTHKNTNSDWAPLTSQLESYLKPHISKYLLQFKANLSYADIECLGFAVMRQPEGTYDSQHFDTPIVINDESSHYRPFVCLLYLNGESVEGGQLIFPAQNRIIIPETGKMLIFPCSYMYPHKVATISSGERIFIRVNYKFKSEILIDSDLDNWDVSKDGIQSMDK